MTRELTLYADPEMTLLGRLQATPPFAGDAYWLFDEEGRSSRGKGFFLSAGFSAHLLKFHCGRGQPPLETRSLTLALVAHLVGGL